LLTGEVRFDERRVTHLSTQADGVVRKVHVALGDQVKEDQALLDIESVVVGEAQGAYLEAQATLDLARRNYERVAELRRETIASGKEYLQSKTGARGGRDPRGVRPRHTHPARHGPADAKALSQASALGRLALRAPAAGTVLSLHAVPGEVAKSSDSLAPSATTQRFGVWADLYERDMAASHGCSRRRGCLQRGRQGLPGRGIPRVVDFVSPSMEEASRTVRLRVEVKNPDHRLLAGCSPK